MLGDTATPSNCLYQAGFGPWGDSYSRTGAVWLWTRNQISKAMKLNLSCNSRICYSWNCTVSGKESNHLSTFICCNLLLPPTSSHPSWTAIYPTPFIHPTSLPKILSSFRNGKISAISYSVLLTIARLFCWQEPLVDLWLEVPSSAVLFLSIWYLYLCRRRRRQSSGSQWVDLLSMVCLVLLLMTLTRINNNDDRAKTDDQCVESSLVKKVTRCRQSHPPDFRSSVLLLYEPDNGGPLVQFWSTIPVDLQSPTGERTDVAIWKPSSHIPSHKFTTHAGGTVLTTNSTLGFQGKAQLLSRDLQILSSFLSLWWRKHYFVTRYTHGIQYQSLPQWFAAPIPNHVLGCRKDAHSSLHFLGRSMCPQQDCVSQA